jgi:hypothetical protein
VTPPKKPPHDRDVFVPKTKTPLKGVPVADRSASEDWSGDTGTHEALNDDTPVGLETVDAAANARLRARAKETNITVKALHSEMTGHVERLDKSIVETKAEVTGLRTDVNKLGTHVVDAISSVNDAVSSLNNFQGVVVENQLQRQRVTYEAHTSVDKHAKIAEIEDQADATKQSRKFKYRIGSTLLKILAAAGVVAATALATHFIEKWLS